MTTMIESLALNAYDDAMAFECCRQFGQMMQEAKYRLNVNKPWHVFGMAVRAFPDAISSLSALPQVELHALLAAVQDPGNSDILNAALQEVPWGKRATVRAALALAVCHVLGGYDPSINVARLESLQPVIAVALSSRGCTSPTAIAQANLFIATPFDTVRAQNICQDLIDAYDDSERAGGSVDSGAIVPVLNDACQMFPALAEFTLQAIEDGAEDACYFDVSSLPSSGERKLALAVGGLATHWAESSVTSTINWDRMDALWEQAKKALKTVHAPHPAKEASPSP